jgi:hypothetical protein
LVNNSTFFPGSSSRSDEKKLAALDLAKKARAHLKTRLEEEGADDLLKAFTHCGDPLKLHCLTCGHVHIAESRCRRKWCPVCSRKIATERALKYAAAVDAMQWPLFVTLTMPNVEQIGLEEEINHVRKLRRAFGKLRHRKLWSKRVRGGVAAIEVTNIGNGWHPHLHAIIDCQWLAWKVKMPPRGTSRAVILERLKAANQELGETWAKCLGVKSSRDDWAGTIYKVKRTSGSTVVQEVLKYSVKGDDLVKAQDDIAPLIRVLDRCRLVTSFGSLFGKLRVTDEEPREPFMCPDCGDTAFAPESPLDALLGYRRRP